MTLLENHSKFFTVKSIHSSELKEQGHKDDIKATVPQCQRLHMHQHPPNLRECTAVSTLEEQGQSLRMETEERKRSLKSAKQFPHMFRVLSKQQNSLVQLCIWKEGRRVGEHWPFPQSWSLLISLPHKPFVVSGPWYGCSV